MEFTSQRVSASAAPRIAGDDRDPFRARCLHDAEMRPPRRALH